MADRNTFNGSSTDVPWPNVGMPEGFGDQYARHIKTLYDVAAFPLTDIGGTADDVTATLDPDLDSGGLVDGMKFTLTWASNNTGPMTLAINGGAAVDVLQADGSVMIAGAAKAGARVLLEYIGGDFRIIGGGSGGGAVDPYYTAITASTTWTKPAGFPDDAIVEIEAWGAGASGGYGTNYVTGGGGGGYSAVKFRYADIPSYVSVVIGAGGASRTTNGPGANGGATSFGSILTVPGGTNHQTSGITTAPPGGQPGGVSGTLWAGGNGGISSDTTVRNGGNSVFGGGGGGGSISNAAWPLNSGGASMFGGGGGAGGRTSTPATAGTAPGGGGGAGYSAASGAGARGEVRIRIYG